MTTQVLIGKTSYRLLLNVRHWSGPDYNDSVILKSEEAFASIHVGERLTIGDLEGYPEFAANSRRRREGGAFADRPPRRV